MLDWDVDLSHVAPTVGGIGLGPEYLLTASGDLVGAGPALPVDWLSYQAGGGALGGGAAVTSAASASPTATLVGSSTGLEINLLWDASVRNAGNWQAIESAVVAAAKIYTDTFANHAVLNIAVGYGEVGGSRMGAGALGESESLGYITNYTTTTHALQAADAGLVSAGLVAPGAFTDTALARANFFITSAEAKALGLANPTATAVDGYIGLSTTSLYFPANGGQIGATQYDAVGVATHELSEVMGRIGLEGRSLGFYRNVYTPLDLFRYSAAHRPDLTPTAGYFSTDLGVTSLNSYNNPANGGDGSDWATLPSNGADAYDAFGNPGVTTNVTRTDLLEVAVLGYAPSKPLATVVA